MTAMEKWLAGAHVVVPVVVGHAPVQPAVLVAPQVAVVHQDVQDGRHLTEDQHLSSPKQTHKLSCRFGAVLM